MGHKQSDIDRIAELQIENELLRHRVMSLDSVIREFTTDWKFATEAVKVFVNEEGQRLIKYHCPKCKTIYGYNRPTECINCDFKEGVPGPRMGGFPTVGLPDKPGVPFVPSRS